MCGLRLRLEMTSWNRFTAIGRKQRVMERLDCSDLCLCGVCTAGLLSRMENSHLFISRKDGAEKEVTSPRFWLISLIWVTRRRGEGMGWIDGCRHGSRSGNHTLAIIQKHRGWCVCVSMAFLTYTICFMLFFCRILHLKNAVSLNATCMVIHFDGQMKQ